LYWYCIVLIDWYSISYCIIHFSFIRLTQEIKTKWCFQSRTLLPSFTISMIPFLLTTPLKKNSVNRDSIELKISKFERSALQTKTYTKGLLQTSVLRSNWITSNRSDDRGFTVTSSRCACVRARNIKSKQIGSDVGYRARSESCASV